jgi:hypothetical protein
MKTTHTLTALAVSILLTTGQASAKGNKEKENKGKTAPDSYSIDVTAIDAKEKARKGSARVDVSVTGIQLTDPDLAQEKPNPAQGHIHYQLDTSTVIATTCQSLSFHNLSHGKHIISVRLVGNDHQPLGPEKAVAVIVP